MNCPYGSYLSRSEGLMKRTGVFFTYFQGERLKDFPEALEGLLEKENISYYDAVYSNRNGLYYLEPLEESSLLDVHSPRLIAEVKSSADYRGALYSAGGTVQAAREIRGGGIDNAFVFTGFGDHHAGRNFNGGLCYFNGAALAVEALRGSGVKKFAIVDTDSHHADGTRDIFGKDADVLHVCFCDRDHSDLHNNLDVRVPERMTDEEYLAELTDRLSPAARSFQPEYIFWEYGYDATEGEYGDKGISMECHLRIAEIIKGVADEVCAGRLITILCGGSRREIATFTIPRIIAILAS
jgi:acetoin utilization deacetylase AcuC-like enzyme